MQCDYTAFLSLFHSPFTEPNEIATRWASLTSLVVVETSKPCWRAIIIIFMKALPIGITQAGPMKVRHPLVHHPALPLLLSRLSNRRCCWICCDEGVRVSPSCYGPAAHARPHEGQSAPIPYFFF